MSRAHERYKRQMTDGRVTANSEREWEFMFAKNKNKNGIQLVIL